MNVKDNGQGSFENPKPGAYPARCFRVIDLGTQPNSYQGKPSNPVRKVVLCWELDETMSDGRPFSVTSRYTASLNQKAALRRDLESWRGVKFSDADLKNGFDLRKLLGATCYLNLIESKDGNYINVSSIMRLPKGMQMQHQVNPSFYFSLDEFDQESFNKLSDKMKSLVEQSPEYKRISTGGGEQVPLAAGKDADDIPF